MTVRDRMACQGRRQRAKTAAAVTIRSQHAERLDERRQQDREGRAEVVEDRAADEELSGGAVLARREHRLGKSWASCTPKWSLRRVVLSSFRRSRFGSYAYEAKEISGHGQ